MSPDLAGLGIWGKMNIEIPKSIQYITGEQNKGYDQITNFFNSIIKENNLAEKLRNCEKWWREEVTKVN